MMNCFSKLALATTALIAAAIGAAPSIATTHASDGYHWEYTPGPRGMAHRVADRPGDPIAMARETSHWCQGFGPHGTATGVPAERAERRMPIERMADAEPMDNAG